MENIKGTIGDGSKVVAIYVRTSTAQQNTEIQIQETENYCARRGWKVIAVLQDKLTGRNLQRPGFQEVIRLARARTIDILVVYKLDRAFRSLSDCVMTVTELHELGVEFLSLKDSGMDFTTPTGRLLFHIIASFAAFEVDLIRSRTRAGIENAKRKGVRFGRPPLKSVDRILELHGQGLSTRAIAKEIGISKSAAHKLIQKSKPPKQNK